MNDQVLTDEEKDALVEGVASGDVEVQTGDGVKYATVDNYVISQRNHIVTNSFPRLQNLNRKFAGGAAKSASALLNDKVEIGSGELRTSTWGEFCESRSDVALVYEFTAKPLEGSAVFDIQSDAVRHIVETFYGGSRENPPRHEIEGFTRGESNVVSLFCTELLKRMTETWQSLIVLDAEESGVYQSTDVVEIIDNSETVVCSEFTLVFGDEEHRIHLVWPVSMLASLLPVLEGAKRERDAAEDARWEKVIRARIPEALVDVSSRIGNAQMTLRQVAQLEAGDIIDLENPRTGTVFARHVPVLEGRFGVHDGCYAIEATRWLTDVTAAESIAS
ncbi:MAG: hypothetical protein HKN77_02095 [Woeseiaceae bacterium]|nr:hypothetical protein [Woeseiaceae bacterium]